MMSEERFNKNTNELPIERVVSLETILSETFYRPVPDDPAGTDMENRPVWRISFDLADDPTQRLGFDVNGEVVVGRDLDDGRTIDLATFEASARGVSRRHLLLRPAATHLYAIDLESTNGTMQNGRSIGVRTPYSLSDGDLLSLGQLRLILRIIERPHFQTGSLARKVDLADAMTEIAKSITSQLDLDEVLNQVVEAAMTLTSAGDTSIWLVDEESGDLFLEAQRGIEDEAIQRMRLPIDGESLAGRVIQTGEPLRVWRQPGEDQIKVKTNYLVEALVYVPIMLGGTTFGVLAATQGQPGRRFDRRDERLLTAIADFAAIAIQNARIYQATDAALARRYQELSALNELSRALNASLDLDRVYEVLLEQVNKHWPVEKVRICLLDEQERQLVPFHSENIDTKPFGLHAGISGWVVRVSTAFMSNEPAAHELFHAAADSIDGAAPRSMICVPLRVQERVVGVLTLFNKVNGEFSLEDLSRLEAFANPMATAVENARLFKESEQRRAAIQATASALPQPLLILDDMGGLLVANQSANKLLQSNMSQLFDGIARGVGRTAEVEIGEQTFLTTAEHLTEVGTIVVMQDITYVKRLEHDRAEFMHMLSHDLKNPLAAIVGWKSLLEKTTELDERGTRYLNQIGLAVDRMLKMIAELLTTVTEEASIQLVEKPCDLYAVVDQVLADSAGAALYKSITLRQETAVSTCPILADENRLYHMVLNLVDNAIKYSPRQTAVHVSVFREEQWLGVRVRDEGPGIPEEDRKRLFDKYFRGAAAQMQPGSGVGLSAVQNIAKAHGGKASVANRPEGGAEFTVRLPASLLIQEPKAHA
jgi:K+-sensing histidine kinase KdpD